MLNGTLAGLVLWERRLYLLYARFGIGCSMHDKIRTPLHRVPLLPPRSGLYRLLFSGQHPERRYG